LVAILFVCTANICRSPMAELVLKARRSGFGLGAQEAFNSVQSAGAQADPRAQRIDARAAAALLRRQLTPDKKWRSRRVQPEDFERFDLLLAMESRNLLDLKRQCPPELQPKLKLLLDFAPGFEGRDLPDPYFGPAAGFDHVLALIERGVGGLGEAWRRGELGQP
jgi:protein-tyrosine phosphatase